MPRNEDWYLELEREKVLADPVLKVLPLEAVGLWLYALLLMHGAVRKGYLSDPLDATGRAAMSLEQLAAMLGRPTDIIGPIWAVITASPLFSVSDDGVVFSRGMVWREELRQTRRAAGKKGGDKSALLKQNIKQTPKQTLGIGVGEETPNPFNGSDFAQAKSQANEEYCALGLWEPAQALSFLYRSLLRGHRVEEEMDCVCAFAEILKGGIAEKDVEADLKRPDRVRSEYLWEIRKRLLKAPLFNCGTGILDNVERFNSGGVK